MVRAAISFTLVLVARADRFCWATGILALATCIAKVRPADMVQLYENRVEEIWTKKGGLFAGVSAPKYDAQNLTKILQEYSVSPARATTDDGAALPRRGRRQLRLDEPHADAPKTFVLAAKEQLKAKEPYVPCLFRAYPHPELHSGSEGRNDCEVWEAGRATSAAPTFFEALSLGSDRYELRLDSTGFRRC